MGQWTICGNATLRNPEARFGLLASSKDRDLPNFGVQNDFQSTKRVRFGPWYGDAGDHPAGRSCRRLEDCVTEFGAQGLAARGESPSFQGST